MAAVILLTSCSSPTDRAGPAPGTEAAPSAPAVVSETPTAESPSPAAPRVVLPHGAGARAREVRPNLHRLGVVLRTRPLATCGVPPGVVVAQDPPGGARVRPGDTVLLTVARVPVAATCVGSGRARAAVRRLHAWALGDAPAPAFADEVRVMQGNRVELTLTGAQARERGPWTLPGGYAERVPLHAVRWLADHARLASRDVPPYLCPDRAADLPPDLLRRLAMSRSLVTTGAEACLQVGAVQAWVDGRGRIEAVNLLLGSP